MAALSDSVSVAQARIERNLAETSENVRYFSGAVRNLADAQASLITTVQNLANTVAHLEDTVGHLEDIVKNLADNQTAMQASLQNLISQIDRFIRGQQKNGGSLTE